MESRLPTSGSARRLVMAISASLAGLLFAAGGILTIIAAELRWGDACAGSWDDQSCITIQDHRYDYVAPMEQPPASGTWEPAADWVPIPGAAQLAGIALVMVAVAMMLMFAAMRVPVWLRWAQAVISVAVGMLGAVTIAGGVLGRPLAGFNTVTSLSFFIWALAGPLVLSFTFTQRPADPRSEILPRTAALGFCLTLACATPFIAMILCTLLAGYSAYDSTPWDEAVTGGLYILTGAIIIAGVVWTVVRRSHHGPRIIAPAANVS